VNADELWDRITRKVPPKLRTLVPDVRKFLCAQEKPLCVALSTGSITADQPPTDDDARHLEATIIDQVRQKKLGKQDAADWLKILYDANRVLSQHQVELPPTRLADVLPPSSSPFNPQNMAGATHASTWRNALLDWVRKTDKSVDPSAITSATLLSAVLFGALLDKSKLMILARKLDTALVVAGRCAYMEFDMPFSGEGNTHLQRWFPDPLTEMLWARIPNPPTAFSEKQLLKNLRGLLREYGVLPDNLPTSLTNLVEYASFLWNTEAPPLELHAIQRSFLAHSLKSDTWLRIQGCELPCDRDIPAENIDRPTIAPAAQSIDADESLFLHDWLSATLTALDTSNTTVSEQLRAIGDASQSQAAHSYLEWLEFMREGNSSRNRGLSPRAIRQFFETATLPLVGILGEDDPAALQSEELFEIYRELIEEGSTGKLGDKLARSFQEFHHFLSERYQHEKLDDVRNILGDESGLNSVDARIVTPDEYCAALDWLTDLDLSGDSPAEITVARLVLIMAFRTGMRRMEILGLRLIDMKVGKTIDCLVRPHASRTLKTVNAKRCMPLGSLLEPKELEELRQWYQLRLAAAGDHETPQALSPRRKAKSDPPPVAIAQDFLFGLPGIHRLKTGVEPTVDRIHAALRGVTGNEHLRMHHLRHSFGTWTLLRLRAADYPEIIKSFAHLPVTASELSDSKRFRQALLGEHESPSRTYAYAVAKLLGHSSPAVSMEHYVHSSDLVLHAIARRNLDAIPRQRLLDASGISNSLANKYREQGVDELLLQVRKRHPRRFLIALPIPQNLRCAPSERFRRQRKTRAMPPLALASAILYRVVCQDSASVIASRFDVAERQVVKAAEVASQIGQAIEVKAKIPYCPPPNRLNAEIEWVKLLEARFEALARKDSPLLLEGINLFLYHYNRDNKDVVFNRSEVNSARRFLKFIKALEIPPHDLQFILRNPDTNELPASWLDWKTNLKLTDNVQVNIIRPKNEKKASYSCWLGIKLINTCGGIEPTNATLPTATARTMLLAKVALSLQE